jgi:sialidase-1
MLFSRLLRFGLCGLLTVIAVSSADAAPKETLLLPPSEENPRNSEGDFIALRDGRLLFVYTHFVGGDSDHASAHLAGRFSSDHGATWSGDDVVVLPNEGTQNLMSVSLLRLQDGRIALFYVRKNSLGDCRPCARFSEDEAATWSDPVLCIPDSEIGYYVLNNDRVIQLASGRLVIPLAEHNRPSYEKWTGHGTALCYLSDDGGATWRRGTTELDGLGAGQTRVMLQEPGLIELKDGRVMMFCRTDQGCQYLSYSKDGGDHWSPLEASSLLSPVSPASIERIPSTGDLLLVWNDHRGIPPDLKKKRTPLTVALSKDDGKTWGAPRSIETNPDGWYCYTAIHFEANHVLLAYCAGDRRENNGLAVTRISMLPLDWL